MVNYLRAIIIGLTCDLRVLEAFRDFDRGVAAAVAEHINDLNRKLLLNEIVPGGAGAQGMVSCKTDHQQSDG